MAKTWYSPWDWSDDARELSLTLQSCHTHTSVLVVQSESSIVLRGPIRGRCIPDSSDWHERGELGPNFADKPKWTQLRIRLFLTKQLWRKRDKLFSSSSYILPCPEPTFATDCKNIQNFPHLKTIKNKLLFSNIYFTCDICLVIWKTHTHIYIQ